MLTACFLATGVAGLLFALGLCYRACAVVVFLGYTYFFFLDAALFNNHYYLICLISFLMI
jgi:hypothetical protein